MIGNVDDRNRALLTVSVSKCSAGPAVSVMTWIDTAFDGHLVFSRKLIDELDLETLVETEAILADGSKVVLETFLCFVDWFGERKALQVIANDGSFPLLGTGLLERRVSHIDFSQRTLTLG